MLYYEHSSPNYYGDIVVFFKQKSDVLFRKYESFGYITDNRNLGYKQTNNNENNIGDKIVSQSGAVFLSVLGRKPQTLDDLAQKISKQFIGVDIGTIKNDAKEFYSILEQDGFIVSGETLQECNEKDTKFSYKTLESKMIQNTWSKWKGRLKLKKILRQTILFVVFVIHPFV
jgi:hypothetical protein